MVTKPTSPPHLQFFLDAEREVLQRGEGPQGVHAAAVGDAGHRLPQRGTAGGLRGRVPVLRPE